MRLLIRQARHHGWKELQVSLVWSHNMASQKLFERLGFERLEDEGWEAGQRFFRYRLMLR